MQLPTPVYDFVNYVKRFDSEEIEITVEDEKTLEEMCDYLSEQAGQSNLFSDPLCGQEIERLRMESYASWSYINSIIEARDVAVLDSKASTYGDFCSLTSSHWLTAGSDELVNHEIDFLAMHDVPKGRCCMIGPGALPYTGLSFLNKGFAEVDFVDMLGDAIDWSRKWVGRYFPDAKASYILSKAEEHDYSGYDVVIVASMLWNKKEILAKVAEAGVPHILIRTTEPERPLGILENRLTADDLSVLAGDYTYLGQTNPPKTVANCTLLYKKAA